MRFGTKIGLGFALVIAFVAVVGIAGYLGLMLSESQKLAVIQQVEISRTANEAVGQALAAESSLFRDIIHKENQTADASDLYEKALAAARETKRRMILPDNQAKAQEVIDSLETCERAWQSYLLARKAALEADDGRYQAVETVVGGLTGLLAIQREEMAGEQKTVDGVPAAGQEKVACLNRIQECRISFNLVRLYARKIQMVVRQNEREQVAKDMLAELEKADQVLQELGRQPATSEKFADALKSIKAGVADYRVRMEKDPEARDRAEGILRRQLEPAMDAVTAQGRKMQAGVYQFTRDSERKAEGIALRSRQLILLMIMGSVLTAAAAAFFITRSVVVPLGEMVKDAEEIAAGRLVSREFEISRTDEVGVLSASFSRMHARLAEMVGQMKSVAAGDLRQTCVPRGPDDEMGEALAAMVGSLKKTTGRIAESASTLAVVAAELSDEVAQLQTGTTESAAAIGQTAATLEQVRQTARLTNQNADGVVDNARRGGTLAEEGRERVEDISMAMNQIRDRMDFIAQHALQLNERNQKIGEIIAAVNDLADQSNILAVNASIEASKAGEEGKGFVVLAQEIRKLAEQSKQSTREIRVILEEIQKATSAAVLATDEGSKAVAKGEEQARLVREAILRLAAGVAGSAQSAVVIANSAKEQLIGMDQTSGAMDSIRMAGEQDRKIAARLKETANTLGDLSRQLVETSRSFRV